MEGHKEPNYMAVFWWLAVLTVMEIAATFLPIPHTLIAILLVGMALTKARSAMPALEAAL